MIIIQWNLVGVCNFCIFSIDIKSLKLSKPQSSVLQIQMVIVNPKLNIFQRVEKVN